MKERIFVNTKHYFGLILDIVIICKALRNYSDETITSGLRDKSEDLLDRITIICSMNARLGLPDERSEYQKILDVIRK